MRRWTPRTVVRSIRRHQSSMDTLVSRIKPETSKPASPLVSYMSSITGVVDTSELLKQWSSNTPSQLSSFVSLEESVLENVMSQLSTSFPGNDGLQTFIISELGSLVRSNDPTTFMRVIRGLGNSIGLSSSKMASQLSSSSPSDQTTTMTLILINICLHWKNTLLASSLMLKNDVSDKHMVERVIKSLLLKDPRREEIQLDLIIKIATKYDYKLNEYEISQFANKLENMHDKSALLSKIGSFLQQHLMHDDLDIFVKTVYRLIRNDSLIHNKAGMYTNWRRIALVYPDIMDHDLRILSIMIKEFLHSKTYHKLAEELVSQIPREHYTHPFLVEPMMEYAFKKNDIEMCNGIVERLEPPVPRVVLSILLKMNMKLGDYKGLEKIMNQISKSGMTSTDYATVIHDLLKRGDLMDAISFTSGIPPHLSNSAYLKIINHLINTRKQFKETELAIIQEIIDKSTGVFNMKHSFWTMVGSMFIKYLTKNHAHTGVFQSKQIYERSTSDFLLRAYADSRLKSPILDTKVCLNPWSIDHERRHLIRLQINSRSRAIVVKTIFDRAQKLKMKEVMNWSLVELTNLGIKPRDVKIDVTRSYNSHAAKVGFREEDSEAEFNEIWDQGSARCVKDNETLQKMPANGFQHSKQRQ